MLKAKRLITAEDLLKFKWVRAVALSPDESKIAFTLEWIDENKQKYWSNLWVVPTSGGAPRRFTTGKVKDRQPVWSPDGKFIAFVSHRDEEDGIYIIPADGGEARKLVSMDGSFDSLSWSPDGKKILLRQSRYSEKPFDLDDLVEFDLEAALADRAKAKAATIRGSEWPATRAPVPPRCARS